MQKIKTIIIESRYIIREGLKQLLETRQGIDIIGEALHCGEAYSLLQKPGFNMIIMGNSDCWLDELPALRAIRQLHPQTPIILICNGSEATLQANPLNKYVDLCLPMNIDGNSLTNAVWRVTRRPLACTQRKISSIAQAEVHRHHRLSTRELEVLCIMARGKTNQQIASVLTLSSKTVSTYRQRILAKLGFQNNAQLIQYAIQNGLVD